MTTSTPNAAIIDEEGEITYIYGMDLDGELTMRNTCILGDPSYHEVRDRTSPYYGTVLVYGDASAGGLPNDSAHALLKVVNGYMPVSSWSLDLGQSSVYGNVLVYAYADGKKRTPTKTTRAYYTSFAEPLMAALRCIDGLDSSEGEEEEEEEEDNHPPVEYPIGEEDAEIEELACHDGQTYHDTSPPRTERECGKEEASAPPSKRPCLARCSACTNAVPITEPFGFT